MPFSIHMYIFQQIFPKHKKLDKFILYNSMSKLDTNQSNLGKGWTETFYLDALFYSTSSRMITWELHIWANLLLLSL